MSLDSGSPEYKEQPVASWVRMKETGLVGHESLRVAGDFAWKPAMIPGGDGLEINADFGSSLSRLLQLEGSIFIKPLYSPSENQNASINGVAGTQGEATAESVGTVSKPAPDLCRVSVNPDTLEVILEINFSQIMETANKENKKGGEESLSKRYAEGVDREMKNGLRAVTKALFPLKMNKDKVLAEDYSLMRTSLLLSMGLMSMAMTQTLSEIGTVDFLDALGGIMTVYTSLSLLYKLSTLLSYTMRMGHDEPRYAEYLLQEIKDKRPLGIFIPKPTLQHLLIPKLNMLSLPKSIVRDSDKN